jgi:hypothetical protein
MKVRARLASAAAVLALTASVVSIMASPASAAACGGGQGQPLLMGCDGNTATDRTIFFFPTSGTQAFVVDATGGGSVGVQGAGGAFGVEGLSNAGTGVHGQTFAAGQNGVYGQANNSAGSGVYGQNDATGYGVAGRAAAGTGVLADSANGTALKVTGRTKFSTSGTAVIASGQKKVTVTLAGVTTTDFVLATVQGSGAFFVKNASAGSGQFTININKAPTAPATVTVAYFVISAS